jgi:peptidoglycan/LPS O-acetylase OafA/YrhL
LNCNKKTIEGKCGIEAGPGQTPKNPEPNHFAYIDAVRGLAFLAVLTLHAALSVGDFPGKDLLRGAYGVQLFFLASAITLCYSMSARRQVDKFPVFYFYLRRLFRIAPLFWFAMVFYWTFPGVMPAFWLSQWAPSGVHASYFVLTALFLHGWHPYTFNSIVPGGWSIAVEMTFYVFFPLIFLLLNSLKKAAVAVLVSILYGKLWYHVDSIHTNTLFDQLHHHFFPGIHGHIWDFYAGFWFPSQLPVFLIGFFAYHLLKNDSIKALAKTRFWAACLFCFCGMVLVSLFRGYSGFIPTPFLIVLSLAGIIIAMSGAALRWLVNPCICYVGKISYSCYLAHFAALGITLKLLGIHLTVDLTFCDAGGSLFNLFLFLKIIVIALALTVIISTITLHLVENPGIALGRKIIQRITARSVRR